jgi:hypothetical protein
VGMEGNIILELILGNWVGEYGLDATDLG